MSKQCMNCGQELPDHAKFCNKCGTDTTKGIFPAKESTEINVSVCPKCNASLKATAKFCGICGAPIKTLSSTTTQNENTALNHTLPMPETQALNGMGNTQFQGSNPSHMSSIPMQQGHFAQTAPAYQSQTQTKRLSGEMILSIAVVIGCAVLFLLLCFSSMESDTESKAITDLKEIIFHDYGEDTLKTAVSKTLRRVEWKAAEVTDEDYYVTVSGYSPDWETEISVTFNITYDDEYVYAEMMKCKAYDEESSDFDDISFAMSVIYDNY